MSDKIKKTISLHKGFKKVQKLARKRVENPCVKTWKAKTAKIVKSVELGYNTFELEDYIEFLEHCFYFHELADDQRSELMFSFHAY